MSAFVVSKAHIDALVNVAVFGPKGFTRGRWYSVYFGNPSRKADDHNVDEIGTMLMRENVKSVCYRYQETENGPLPGPTAQYWRYDYHFNYPPNELTAVQALKAISCYEYQSCEHPEWKDSEARDFCESLRHNLIGCLPGYEEAAWEIHNA